MTSDLQNREEAVSVGFEQHDHSACVTDAIASADARCEKENLRFTPVRRKVLQVLLEDHKALGAYAILERLREAGFGSQPPVAYRALDFLVEHGFVHKIERLNAFVACAHPGEAHAPAFMICRNCEIVAEAQSTPEKGALGEAAKTSGFRIERTIIEVEGLCPTCVGKENS